MRIQKYWINENSAISDESIREMFNANSLNILAEDNEHLTVQWCDGEIEMYTKQLRNGRHIVQ